MTPTARRGRRREISERALSVGHCGAIAAGPSAWAWTFGEALTASSLASEHAPASSCVVSTNDWIPGRCKRPGAQGHLSRVRIRRRQHARRHDRSRRQALVRWRWPARSQCHEPSSDGRLLLGRDAVVRHRERGPCVPAQRHRGSDDRSAGKQPPAATGAGVAKQSRRAAPAQDRCPSKPIVRYGDRGCRAMRLQQSRR